MAGLSPHGCAVVRQRLEHLDDTTCALSLIVDAAAKVLAADESALAGALRAMSEVISNQASVMVAELRHMMADPDWNGTAKPATAAGEG